MTNTLRSVEQLEAMKEMAEVIAIEQELIEYYLPADVRDALDYCQVREIVYQHQPEFAERSRQAYSRAFAAISTYLYEI